MHEMPRQTFVLSLRRDLRSTAPADWKDRVRSFPGVVAGPSTAPSRIQIEASEECVAELRAQLGHLLLIEPVLLRGLLDS
jgi:hypothetical protein